MKLRFSNDALNDLQEIEVYGVTNFGETASQKYMKRLKQGIEHLQQFPELARPHPLLKANARALPLGSHIILYRCTSENVDILRVVHGRQNLRQED